MIRELDPPEGLSENARKKNINAVLDSISSSIHNTRAVCKKEYMHPSLIEMYIEHPRRYKKLFISAAAPEAAFISFLRTN
jgi:DNA topoisomerase IB